MKLYRYEFKGDGLFTALDYLYDIDMEVNDAEDFKKAEDYFEQYLPTVSNISLAKPFRFYFTEDGIEKFGPYIDIFVRLFQKYYKDKVNRMIIDAPAIRYTIYHDKYQMVIQHRNY